MVSIVAKHVSIDYPVFGKVAAPKERKRTESVRRAELVRTKSRNVVRAIDDFSIEILQGDRLGIIGLNGSGKSTLLRMFGGIYRPSKGELRVEGRVSSMFNVGLGTRMESTGRRNIYLRGYMRGLTKSEVRSLEEEIIEFSGLGDFIDMPLRSYSSGMVLRLSFAIMTTFDPEILLMDEWIGVGDSQFQEKAANRLRSLVERAGITVLCSHNVGIIKENCQRVIWLDKGRVFCDGSPEEVLPEYIAWKNEITDRVGVK